MGNSWKRIRKEIEKRARTGEGRGDQQQEETVEPSQSQAVSMNREAIDSTSASQLQRCIAICDGNADGLKSIVALMT